ncbi:MAG: hypothetical protein R2713_09875 [Ilumatobacteraceae bacterium]|nr:hypothetical protein [Acidimicrobiales bacterium]MCB9392797.1 hypothetical protein [Acidimicrobiaceae bacterium]
MKALPVADGAGVHRIPLVRPDGLVDRRRSEMGDVVMVATMVAFVLLCVGYVGWCDRIVARDDVDTSAGVRAIGAADAEPDEFEAVS